MAAPGLEKPTPRGSRTGAIRPWIVATLVTLCILALPPLGCILLVGGAYLIALVLALAGLWNWPLTAWLVELSVLFWYTIRVGLPPDWVLVLTIWSLLIFFWAGMTFLLRQAMTERGAMAVALALALLHGLLLGPLLVVVALICGMIPHPCGCAGGG